MKEKLVEMTEEQPEVINEQVKRAISIIFQRLKARIQPTKQYTGEQFLTRSLEIIKKATLKVLSNDDEEDEQSSASDIQSDHENEKVDDQPTNGNSVDQQSLNEAISSIPTEHTEQTEKIEQTTTVESEVLSTHSQKSGWDTVDDLQQETNTQIIEQKQNEESTSVDNQTEINPLNDNNEPISLPENVQQVENDSNGSADTIEKNDEQQTQTPPPLETAKEKTPSDNGIQFYVFFSI